MSMPSTPPRPDAPLIEVRNLKKHFPIYKGVFSRVSGHVHAVDGVSFHIKAGETLGLWRSSTGPVSRKAPNWDGSRTMRATTSSWGSMPIPMPKPNLGWSSTGSLAR